SAMTVEVLVERADHLRWYAGADSVGWQRARHHRVRADDGSRADLDAFQDHRTRPNMARLVDDDSPEPRRIQVLVHLGVVREDITLLAEAAVVADANQEAMAFVNEGRGGQVYILAYVHTE